MGDFFKILGLTALEADQWQQDGILTIREFAREQSLNEGVQNNSRIGIVLAGTVVLESRVQEDQRRILDYYESGDVFGGKSLPDMTRDFYYIIASGKCRVAFFDIEKMFEENLLQECGRMNDALMEQSAARLTVHLDIMGQRTMRQKLMAFFHYQKRRKGKLAFSLPFPLTDCADYLAVDRSAMMRELGKMKEEGLVRAQGRKIELL